MKARIRLRQPVLLYVAAFVFGLQVFDPSRIWTILLVAFGGVIAISYWWTVSLARNLSIRRETYFGWERVGGQIEERFTISNHALFPAQWIELEDESTLPDYRADDLYSVASGGFKQWNSIGVCKRRGLYYLGGTTLHTGDAFGVFQATLRDPARTPLAVLPQLVDLPPLHIAESGFQGEGRPRPNAPKQSIHATNVREYQHGDSMKLIHWRTTARMNELYVRLVESAPQGDWWIVLDLDQRVLFGDDWDSIEEQSVSLAASLANFGLNAQKSIGLICNGEETAWLPPQKGEGQRWEIMRTLAFAKSGRLELAQLLERACPALGQYRSLILITASLKTDWLQTIHSLSRKGLAPTILLFDPATFGGDRSTRASAETIQEKGITCFLIERGMLRQPEPRRDKRPDWKWSRASNGQIIPTQA